MEIYSRLKQYYRYRRNWRKLQSRQSKINVDKYFARQLNFYSQFIRQNDICFDVGANIGDKTELFLRLGTTVVAVEPQESCWRVLKRRFRNNNVIIESVALADAESSRTLFIDRSHTLASMSQDWITTVRQSGRFSSHNWANQVSVETTTLDALIARYGKPAFCKIDVEGFEFEVLQGLTQPVRVICFEFVSERIEPSLNCIDYVSSLGEAEFNYYLGEAMSFALRSWVDSHKIKTMLTTMNKDIENYGEIYVRFPAG